MSFQFLVWCCKISFEGKSFALKKRKKEKRKGRRLKALSELISEGLLEVVGVSKETDGLKIWRCDVANDLIETQRNEMR